MRQEIEHLDAAEERPVFSTDSYGSSYRLDDYKAIFNLGKNETAAIVSPQYKLIQHRDVATSFLDACERLNIKTESKIRDQGHRIFMDVSFPSAKLYVQKGEEFIAGFRLINSYDKTTGIMILPMLKRLICSNGMVVETGLIRSFCYRHNCEVAAQFESYVEKALAETISANVKLKAMVNDCIGDSAEWAILDNILPALIKREKHIEQIKNRLQGLTEVTRWDLYNAITHYATHGQQLTPSVEMWLQGKAQTVLSTPLANLPVLEIEAAQ